MTTRREFIKILTGTVIAISLPMGLFGNEEKVTEVIDGDYITWEPASFSNLVCQYYAPQITIKEVGEVIQYEDLGANPKCDKCMYCKHYSKCRYEILNGGLRIS